MHINNINLSIFNLNEMPVGNRNSAGQKNNQSKMRDKKYLYHEWLFQPINKEVFRDIFFLKVCAWNLIAGIFKLRHGAFCLSEDGPSYVNSSLAK